MDEDGNDLSTGNFVFYQDYSSFEFSSEHPNTYYIEVIYLVHGQEIRSNKLAVEVTELTIKSIDDLEYLNDSNENYILVGDLDFSEIKTFNSIKNFTGVLDGQGFSINNLKINSGKDNQAGLFHELKGVVKNLTLNNITVDIDDFYDYVGTIAAKNFGTIDNVTVNGSVSAEYSNNVGGIVGYLRSTNSNGTVCENNLNNGPVNGSSNVGGITGYNFIPGENNLIVDTINYGNVSGGTNVGGISGRLFGGVKNKTLTYLVTDLENHGKITGKTNNVGGLFGSIGGNVQTRPDHQAKLTLRNNLNTGEVSGKNNIGGLIGYGENIDHIERSSNEANITGEFYVGGYIGQAVNGTLKNLENEAVITGEAYVGGIAGKALIVIESVNNGTVLSKGVILENEKLLANVGGIVGYADRVANNLNKGIVTATAPGGQNAGGIVGYLRLKDSGSNENINDGYVTGINNVGGIVGYSYVYSNRVDINLTMSKNANNGNVSGDDNIGGIIGSSDVYLTSTVYSVIVNFLNTVNKGDITGENNVGGLLGYGANATLQSLLFNYGDISGKDYVGGLAGFINFDSRINDGINEGDITGDNYVGGIVGRANVVRNTENKGAVTGGQSVGGIVGYLRSTNSNGTVCENNLNNGPVNGSNNVGGIIGESNAYSNRINIVFSLSNNTNNAEITATGNNVGGIIGFSYTEIVSTVYDLIITVYNSINNGSISGEDNIGGIIGSGDRYDINAGSVNNGTITGNKNVGGLLGYSSRRGVINGLNTGDVTGHTNVGGLAGLAKKVDGGTNQGKVTGEEFVGDLYGKLE